MRFRHGILLMLLTCSLVAQAQNSYRMALLSRWDDDNAPVLATQQYSDVYGWYDAVKQREYAILCGLDSLYFFDVTIPTQPVRCAVRAGRSPFCRNRSVVTYRNYAYAVADQNVSSLQIFDLRYLPDSVHEVYNNDSLCIRAHTVVVDTLSARLYLCHNKKTSPVNGLLMTEALSVLSLQQPDKPTLLSSLQPPVSDGQPLFDFVHDAAVYRDTVFCSTGSNGLFVFDYKNPAQPQLIRALVDYPEKGFNHSPAYDPARKLVSFTDESAGTAVKLYSSSTFSFWQQRSLIRSNVGALAHKSYFKGHTLWVAYYHDGVRAFDISDPANVTPLAWYDTYEQQNYSGILGCWGVYPYLPSGIVLASDMSNGLFILRPDTTTGLKEKMVERTLRLYPNPANQEVNIHLGALAPFTQKITVYTRFGQIVHTAHAPFQKVHTLNLSQLTEGMYLVYLEGNRYTKAFNLAVIR